MKISFLILCVIIFVTINWTHQFPFPFSDPKSYSKLVGIYKETIRTALEVNTDDPKCILCRLGFKIMEELLIHRIDEDHISDLIIDICSELHIETPRVCKGIVKEFRNEVFTVFKKVAIAPNEICDLWLGDYCSGFPDPQLKWNITLPNIPKPPVVPINPPKPGSPVSKVLQLSDIHLDLLYKPGSIAECKEPLCCHDMTDIAAADPPAGKWGDFHHCDTPLNLLENMFYYISQTQKFDYIMLTGDLPAHDIWNQTKENQILVLKIVTNLLIQYFPKTPIFPALGNHESAPVNSFPPPYIKGNMSMDWLYSALAKTWTTWLPNSTFTSIKKGAYYSVLVEPGFRIISINMNYCNNKNLWLFINTTDPAGELSWLVNELQQAETNNEKVHIIGHIPPGIADCFKTWSWNYYRIINRYESTVSAQFFGHTHFDELELFYDESDLKRPINVAYICPSVTPYHGLFPGFRIYTIDGHYSQSSRVVLDHETYIVDLIEANLSDHPKWVKEYSAKDTYNMTSLLPKEWDNLLTSMKTNDTLFSLYYKFYYKSLTHQHCDKECKYKYLCAMRRGRSFDPDICKYLLQ